LSITAFGDGDNARLPLSSETLCTDVTQLSAPGAPAPPTIGGKTSDGGGCALAGNHESPLLTSLLLAAIGLGLSRHRRRD